MRRLAVLTARQKRFVEEYLVDLTATRAVIRAGYSHKGAAQRGNKLLRDPLVAKAIATAQAELSGRLGFVDIQGIPAESQL